MEWYLRVNLLGPCSRLMGGGIPGRGLTKVEKHCSKGLPTNTKSRDVIPTVPEYCLTLSM